MLRLAAPGYERLLQSPTIEATFGGGEANVLVSLACLDKRTRYLTALPKNDIAADAIRQLRRLRRRHRQYFTRPRCPNGHLLPRKRGKPAPVPRNLRSDTVRRLNDRARRNRLAKGPCRLRVVSYNRHHPGAVKNAADESLAALQAAKEQGLVISIDLNYRSNLWKWGKAAPEVMGELAAYADVIIANEEDCQKALGIGSEYDPGKGVIDEKKATGSSPGRS